MHISLCHFVCFFCFWKFSISFRLIRLQEKKRKNVPLSSAFYLGSFLPKNTSLFVRRVTKLWSNFLGYKFSPSSPRTSIALKKHYYLGVARAWKKVCILTKLKQYYFYGINLSTFKLFANFVGTNKKLWTLRSSYYKYLQ